MSDMRYKRMSREERKERQHNFVLNAISSLVAVSHKEIPEGSEVAYLHLILVEPPENRSVMGRKSLTIAFSPKVPTYVVAGEGEGYTVRTWVEEEEE